MPVIPDVGWQVNGQALSYWVHQSLQQNVTITCRILYTKLQLPERRNFLPRNSSKTFPYLCEPNKSFCTIALWLELVPQYYYSIVSILKWHLEWKYIFT